MAVGYKISEIEGIGPVNSEKLGTAGITNTDHMLAKCGSAKGRKTVAEQTGLSAKVLLKWADMADMMRVSGVGRQYGELLKASGVDTVKELRTRKAENGQLVVARLEDEVTVKQFRQRGNIVTLIPKNPDFEPIRVDLRKQNLVIEGLGVGVVRSGKLL